MSGPLGGSKSRIVACRLPPLQISNITSKPVRSCYRECQTKHFYVKLNSLCCYSHCMGKYIAGVTSSPRSRLSMSCFDLLFLQPGPAVACKICLESRHCLHSFSGLLACSDPCFLYWDHTLITLGHHYRTQTSCKSHLASENIHTVISACIHVYCVVCMKEWRTICTSLYFSPPCSPICPSIHPSWCFVSALIMITPIHQDQLPHCLHGRQGNHNPSLVVVAPLCLPYNLHHPGGRTSGRSLWWRFFVFIEDQSAISGANRYWVWKKLWYVGSYRRFSP